jgi:hypothetical protein
MVALWFVSVGDVCALLVDATLGGGGPDISSILRTRPPERCGASIPVVGPDTEAALGGASPTSSMLLTGDRGVKGDEARPGREFAEGLCRAAGLFSNNASTSLRSSSIIDSNDMGPDMIAMIFSWLYSRCHLLACV